jgi:type II secretory pathway component PulC
VALLASCEPHPRTEIASPRPAKREVEPTASADDERRGEPEAGASRAAKRATCRWQSPGPGRIPREAVDHYLRQGPGHLFKVVEVSRYPRRGEGEFQGWKVEEVEDPCIRKALRAGDVVLTVNGRQLVRPADMWELWKLLGEAQKLEVRVRRGGRDKLLHYRIVP